jgi:hypothetical protein
MISGIQKVELTALKNHSISIAEKIEQRACIVGLDRDLEVINNRDGGREVLFMVGLCDEQQQVFVGRLSFSSERCRCGSSWSLFRSKEVLVEFLGWESCVLGSCIGTHRLVALDEIRMLEAPFAGSVKDAIKMAHAELALK